MTVSDPVGSSPSPAAAVVHEQFTADGVYLNTASLGLPPRSVLRALHEALADWQRGRASPPDYDASLNASRAGYAQLVGVDPAAPAHPPVIHGSSGTFAKIIQVPELP